MIEIALIILLQIIYYFAIPLWFGRGIEIEEVLVYAVQVEMFVEPIVQIILLIWWFFMISKSFARIAYMINRELTKEENNK